jgi:hypothetical protein
VDPFEDGDLSSWRGWVSLVACPPVLSASGNGFSTGGQATSDTAVETLQLSIESDTPDQQIGPERW